MEGDRHRLYEQRNEKRASKVLRSGKSERAPIEPQFWKDILPQDKAEYEEFFQKIWTIPLLHNERSTNVIQVFWKEILRRSFLASKSGVYNKTVVHYDSHPRTKFSVYTPKTKPRLPARVVVFIHGGYNINGSEEAFEYLGKDYVENGYILVTLGFRQLVKYNFYDTTKDVHNGYRKIIEVVPGFGGRNNDMAIVTWSGGALNGLPTLYQYKELFEQHFNQVVALGAPSELSEFEHKVAVALFDQEHDIHQCYQPYYFSLGPLRQRVDYLVGVKHLEFPQIYQMNVKWAPLYKEKGFDVSLTINENHDHYDLVLNPHLALDRLREHELRLVDPQNDLSRLLYMLPLSARDELHAELAQPQWKPNFGRSTPEQQLHTQKLFQELLRRYNSGTLATDPLAHFLGYESLAPVDPSATAMSILHNSSCSAVLRLGTERHAELMRRSEGAAQPISLCLAEVGCETNPKQLGTVATYDPAKQQFVLHTITPFHQKYWCGGIGGNSNVGFAVVWARLLVNKKSEGVHAFLVPITDSAGKPYEGIALGDLGDKIGVNGLQNGTLSFKKFAVPRECLLNRLGDVEDADKGRFVSQVSGDPEERVGKSLDRIIYWHISISSAILGVVKAALYTGVTFSRYRWNLSENSKIQYPLLTFQVQQRVLVPLLARTLGLNLLLNLTRRMYAENPGDEMVSILGNLCKVRVSDFGLRAVLAVSESVGALGLSHYNRLNEYLSTARTGVSWAGDNKVLTAKVGRQLLEAVSQNKTFLPALAGVPRLGGLEDLEFVTTLLEVVRFRCAVSNSGRSRSSTPSRGSSISCCWRG